MKDSKLQTIPISFEVTDKSDPRFTFVKIYLMHTGLNLNGSIFTKESVEKNWHTLALTPILGYIKVDENDQLDFDGHKNIIIVNNGEYQLKYIGSAYGCIGENCNPRWEIKKDQFGTEREYLVCDGVLWSGKFSDLKEILDNKDIFKQSMELHEQFSGEFDDYGNFTFSDFKFYGACLLSDLKHEAMLGASVEKMFSFDDFKDEIQTQMEVLKLSLGGGLNNNHVKPITNIDTENIIFEQGGNDMDEKLKLLELFTLTEDQLNSIKENIETYSVSDLVGKLKEFENNTNKNKLIYELSHDDVRDKIYDQLNPYNEETGYRDWNYWVMEVFDDYCIAQDEKSDGEKYYKIPYIVNQETESVTLGEMQEIKMMWLTPEEAQEVENMRSNFEKLTNDFEELQTKVSTLESEKSDFQSKFAALESEKTSLETKCSEFETKLQELQSFQTNTLTNQRNEAENSLFEQFSEKLTEEELKPFKETAKDFSLEELEEKLSAIAYKKIVKFEANKKQKPKINVVFDRNNIPINTGKPYDDILNQYIKKEE